MAADGRNHRPRQQLDADTYMTTGILHDKHKAAPSGAARRTLVKQRPQTDAILFNAKHQPPFIHNLQARREEQPDFLAERGRIEDPGRGRRVGSPPG